MMDNNASSSLKGDSVPAALSYLGKAWEAVWTLRVACFVLFTDIALAIHGDGGLLEWPTGGDKILDHLGLLAVTLAAFGILVSLVVPILASITRSVMYTVAYGIHWPSWLHRRQDDERQFGCVRPRELRDIALKEQNPFLLSLYDNQELRECKYQEELRQLGLLVFSLLLLAAADGALLMRGITHSLVATILALSAPNAWVPCVGVTIVSVWVLTWCWFPPMTGRWIYYPPLYRVIVDRH
jgi:hypothetical protein